MFKEQTKDFELTHSMDFTMLVEYNNKYKTEMYDVIKDRNLNLDFPPTDNKIFFHFFQSGRLKIQKHYDDGYATVFYTQNGNFAGYISAQNRKAAMQVWENFKKSLNELAE